MLLFECKYFIKIVYIIATVQEINNNNGLFLLYLDLQILLKNKPTTILSDKIFIT